MKQSFYCGDAAGNLFCHLLFLVKLFIFAVFRTKGYPDKEEGFLLQRQKVCSKCWAYLPYPRSVFSGRERCAIWLGWYQPYGADEQKTWLEFLSPPTTLLSSLTGCPLCSEGQLSQNGWSGTCCLCRISCLGQINIRRKIFRASWIWTCKSGTFFLQFKFALDIYDLPFRILWRQKRNVSSMNSPFLRILLTLLGTKYCKTGCAKKLWTMARVWW